MITPSHLPRRQPPRPRPRTPEDHASGIDRLLDRVFGSGGAWDGRPLQRVLLLWVFPAVGLVFGGSIVALALHQGGQHHAVGYVVAAPYNCVLDLSDRPGGPAAHRVAQYRTSSRVLVCKPPVANTRVLYDPRTREQAPGPRNTVAGVLFGGAVALLFAGPGILGWAATARRRRVIRRAHPAPTHS